MVKVPPSRSWERSLPSRARETRSARVRGDLREREPVGGVHDRDDQPLGRGDRDPDVGVREDEQRLLVELDVHVRVAHERLRADPRQAGR